MHLRARAPADRDEDRDRSGVHAVEDVSGASGRDQDERGAAGPQRRRSRRCDGVAMEADGGAQGDGLAAERRRAGRPDLQRDAAPEDPRARLAPRRRDVHARGRWWGKLGEEVGRGEPGVGSGDRRQRCGRAAAPRRVFADRVAGAVGDEDVTGKIEVQADRTAQRRRRTGEDAQRRLGFGGGGGEGVHPRRR
jgi:hypothetical protein